MAKTTKELENILSKTHPNDINEYFNNESSDIIRNDFEEYIKSKLKEKGMQLQTIFLKVDISESYGYKLLSLEKHTVQRDLIIKICYVAKFDLYETNKALILYGMSPLYARIKRDALIISLFNNKQRDSFEFDEKLKEFAD